MKKIGILYGQERSFPMALIEKINSKGIEDVFAEPVRIEKVMQGEKSGYAVIIDRISHYVPFYRSYLKNAALTGTAVINNPFWSSADDKFFNNCLMTQIGIPVPKTVILPSFDLPFGTTHDSFFNLAYPLNWESIFKYVGFPAYMKPLTGDSWNHTYRLPNVEAFYQKHAETGQLTMMLQEEIQFEEYFRCFCIGGKYVHIMPYNPTAEYNQQYVADLKASTELMQQIEEIVININRYLGYDFNSVEIALKEGTPYAIDFCNPAPDINMDIIGEENFDWVVENAANYAIERALSLNENAVNLTWGTFVNQSAAAKPVEEAKKTKSKTKAQATGSKAKKQTTKTNKQ